MQNIAYTSLQSWVVFTSGSELSPSGEWQFDPRWENTNEIQAFDGDDSHNHNAVLSWLAKATANNYHK